MITNTKIKVISDDIELENDKGKSIETVSGDISLKHCELADIETVSGDIKILYSSAKNIETTSGDIELIETSANTISTVSGDIELHNSNCENIETVSGDISLYKSKVKQIKAINVKNLDYSEVDKIFVPENTSFSYMNIFSKNGISIGNIYNSTIGNVGNEGLIDTCFKYIKNLFNQQTQISGNNSINIQVSGKNINVNGNKIETEPIVITLPETSEVKEVYFESGKGIVKSYYEVKTNGEFIFLN